MKQVGALFQVQMLESVSATLAFFTRILGYSMEKTEEIMAAVRRDFKDHTLHLYLRWHFVVGRKPAG